MSSEKPPPAGAGSTLSSEEAVTFIKKVGRGNGAITAEDLKFLLDSNKLEMFEGIQSLKIKASDSAKTLVEKLYSKDTRFVYELIQNAEDNSYSAALEQGLEPFLIFRIYSDRIIIDSNENGFSEENVKAICDVDKSTKRNIDGYIGEMGIGFKSVFKIAKMAHIQSGPFSFAFKYDRDAEDAGLGMMIPIAVELEALPPAVNTRMTLTIDDRTGYEDLTTEFRSIPDALLLFLHQLRSLTVEYHPPTNLLPTQTIISEKYTKSETRDGELFTTRLRKATCTKLGGTSTVEKKFYKITKKLQDLPSDKARVDKKKNFVNHATVVLAFPVTQSDEPILEPQYTFAFLPLRRVGFNFLIQSDFVTQANREDVVHSDRNKAILKGVADLFRDAMVAFCNESSGPLRWQWMKYLPHDSISDEFWGQIWPLLQNTLTKTKLVEARDGTGLYLPCELHNLQPSVCDESGDPLLRDLNPPAYLSKRYDPIAVQQLRRLGMSDLKWPKFVDILLTDIKEDSVSRPSRWKSLTFNPKWRTQICETISKLLSKNKEATERFRELPVIPLLDGTWRSSRSSARIYFPYVDKIPIPTDLGFCLVHTKAVENDAWKVLLTQLSVNSCDHRSVISTIHRSYALGPEDKFKMGDCVAHVRFLFYFLPTDSLDLGGKVRLGSHRHQLLDSGTSMYFPDANGAKNAFSPEALFRRDGQLPGFDTNFLHREYLEAVDPQITRNGRSWLQFLENIGGVRSRPQLYLHDPIRLSIEFRFIAIYRSNRLLGTLQHFWKQYEPEIRHVVDELRQHEVMLEHGKKGRLEDAFIPLPKLKQIVADLSVTEKFPFVSVHQPLQDIDKIHYDFVSQLGIGNEDNLLFYVAVLQSYRSINCDIETSSLSEALLTIYKRIQAKYMEERDCRLIGHFAKEELIYVPQCDRVGKAWISSLECVWDGPTWLKSKQRLNTKAYKDLQPLLKDSLAIRDTTQTDILSDLHALKNNQKGPGNLECVEQIYDYLWANHRGPTKIDFQKEELNQLRESFERSKLIYIPHMRGWFAPADCVWADPHVKIPGKVSMATSYDSKKTFFTEKLRVPVPNVSMYIQSLKAMSEHNPAASKLKEVMALIGSLTVTSEHVSELGEARVLPVRLASGENHLVSVSSSPHIDYAIVDNKAHFDVFEGRIAVLDFTLEDLRDTQPFLKACALDGRFTSNLVEETTEVRSGTLNFSVTQSLRHKSEAIVRCAVHFTEPSARKEPHDLFRVFRSSSVMLSDSIRRSMRISQEKKYVSGTQTEANFHLEASEETICLYIPHDEVDREVCFERQLPQKLCEFLGTTNIAAHSVIGGVLRKDNPKVIERILDDAGVGQVGCDFRSLHREFEEKEPVMQDLIAATRGVHLSESTPREPGPTIPRSGRVETDDFTSRILSTTPRSIWSSDTTEVGQEYFNEEPHSQQKSAFQTILENVVDVARHHAAANILGDREQNTGRVFAIDSLPPALIKEVFSSGAHDRNSKLGATGELYMFEYLKGLDLPGFDLNNWRSSIRERVHVHPEYTNIQNIQDWVAISDIEYEDTSGKMTRFLFEKGLLDQDIWAEKRPKYHFEVKATTSSNWQEPFFMSKRQEQFIRENRAGSETTPSHVYIVCRIFNIGRGSDTGFNLYVDPEALRRDQRLEFTTHTWAVKPCWYPGMLLGSSFRRTSAEAAFTTNPSRDDSSPRIISNERTDNTIAAANNTPSANVTRSKSRDRPAMGDETDTASSSRIEAGSNTSRNVSAQMESVIAASSQTNGKSTPTPKPIRSPGPTFSFGRDLNSTSQTSRDRETPRSVGPDSSSSNSRVSDPVSVAQASEPAGKKSPFVAGPVSGGAFLFNSTPTTSKSAKPSSFFGPGSASSGTSLFGSTTAASKPKESQPSILHSGQTSNSNALFRWVPPISKPLEPGSLSSPAIASSGTSLFGSSPSTPKPIEARSSLFISGSKPSATSLFASTPPVSKSSESRPSIFGSEQASVGTSLFSSTLPISSPTETRPSPVSSQRTSMEGGLFGSTPLVSKPTESPSSDSKRASSGTSLFGSTAPVFKTTETPPFGSQRASSGTSLFGSPPSTSKPTETSLFGSQQASHGTSLFGSPPTVSKTTETSLFGSQRSSSGTSLFSSFVFKPTETSLFGSQQASRATSIYGSYPFHGLSRDKSQALNVQPPMITTALAGSPPYHLEVEITGETAQFHSITANEIYRKYSVEELRVCDYEINLTRPFTSGHPLFPFQSNSTKPKE